MKTSCFVNEIVAALPTIRGDEEEDSEEDADETVEVVPAPANARLEAVNILMSAVRNWARAIAEGRRAIGGQSGRVIEFVKNRLPPESELANVDNSRQSSSTCLSALTILAFTGFRVACLFCSSNGALYGPATRITAPPWR
jgi:hypothetical protein